MSYLSLKRFLGGIVVSILTLSPSLAGVLTPSTALAAPLNAYIRGSSSTVYWHTADGRRFVFPTARTFLSWQGTNQPSVTTISDVELYRIPIAGNMTYRPGARLLKTRTDPRVYAVARYGVLRWVTNEYVAQSLYGSNWNQMIDDISDEFFINYTIGAPIYNTSDYSPTAEYYSVNTPSDNISAQASVNNNPGNYYTNGSTSLEVSSDRSSVGASETNREIRLTAIIRNLSLPTERVRIQFYEYNEGQLYPGTRLFTCTGYTSCGTTTILPTSQTNYTRRYMVTAEDTLNGQAIVNPYYLYVTAYGYNTNSNSGIISLSVNPSTIGSLDTNRTATFNAYLSNTSGFSTDRVRIQIVNDSNGGVERTCNGTLSCSVSYTPAFNAAYSLLSYHAEFRDRENNNLIASSPSVVLTISGRISDPVANQLLSNTSITTEIMDHSLEGIYDRARIRVRLVNPPLSLSGTQINLYRNNDQLIGYSADSTPCIAQTECVFIYGSDQITSQTFYARVQDAYGNIRTSNPITITFNPSVFGTNRFLSSTRIEGFLQNRTTNGANETIEYRARLINPPSNLSGIIIRIYEDSVNNGNDPLLTTCNNLSECPVYLTNSTQITRTLYARAWDTFGNNLGSSSQTITYGGGQNQPPFQVTSVYTVLDGSQPNSCNNTFGSIGVISTNGAGTVTYQWERSDGTVLPAQTLTFTQAETRNVNTTWNPTGTASGWMRLRILSPNSFVSNQITVAAQCNANPTLSASLYTSTDPAEARANSLIRVDTNLTLTRSDNQVRVEIFNQDQQLLRTCYMTASGFCYVENIRIPANASGSYSFYARATDNYGQTVSSNQFYVRIIP